MDDERFSLQELADEAGVSTRTVRYYIAEGLLEPPVLHGARSHYTRAHLDRLTAIALLKEAYLPLREIRKRLAGVSDQELPALIAELGQQRASAPPTALEERSVRYSAEPEGAAEYLERIAPPAPHRRLGSFGSPATAPMSPLTLPPEPKEQRWRRIAINDEAELLLSEEQFERNRERIDAFITWARRLFGPHEH